MAQVLSSTAEALRPLALGSGPASSKSSLTSSKTPHTSCRQRLREGLLCSGKQHGLEKTRDDTCRHQLCRRKQGRASNALSVSTHSVTTAWNPDERSSDKVTTQAAAGGQSPLDFRAAHTSADLRESDQDALPMDDEDEDREIPNSSVSILGVDGYNEWHHISHPPPFRPSSQGSDSKSTPLQDRSGQSAASNSVTTSSVTDSPEARPAQVSFQSHVFHERGTAEASSLRFSVLVESAGWLSQKRVLLLNRFLLRRSGSMAEPQLSGKILSLPIFNLAPDAFRFQRRRHSRSSQPHPLTLEH